MIMIMIMINANPSNQSGWIQILPDPTGLVTRPDPKFLDPDPARSSNSGSCLDPDLDGSKNSGSGASLHFFHVNPRLAGSPLIRSLH